MRAYLFAGLAATLTVAACSPPGADPAAKSEPQKAASPSAAAETACPSADFAAFLPRFMDDADLQRRFTQAPLTSSHIDAEAEPEPRQVTEVLAADRIGFPVMPSRAKLAAEGRTLEIGGDAAHPKVKIEKPDTDWLAFYTFERTDCWRLIAVDDRSL